MTELPSGTATFLFTDLEDSTRLWDEHPDPMQIALARHDQLLSTVAHSRAIATPDDPDVLQALGLLAKLRARRDERMPAIGALREAVVRARDTGQVLISFCFVLNNGVNVAADLDAPEFAATLGAAVDRADQEAVLDQVRASLGPVRYEAAIAKGAAMSYEQTVEYTLGELDRLRRQHVRAPVAGVSSSTFA